MKEYASCSSCKGLATEIARGDLHVIPAAEVGDDENENFWEE
jgi:hypothetical protein